jgi:hypothetical protein
LFVVCSNCCCRAVNDIKATEESENMDSYLVEDRIGNSTSNLPTTQVAWWSNSWIERDCQIKKKKEKKQ